MTRHRFLRRLVFAMPSACGRCVGVLVAFALAAGCQPLQQTELRSLAELLPGRYAAPHEGQTVYHKIVAIEAPKLGAQVFYHQISRERFDGAPLQQKIYVLSPGGDAMRALVVSQDAAKYRNLEMHPQLAVKLEADAFLQFPSACDFVWTREAGGYLGRVEPAQCQYESPAFGGTINPSMTYRLSTAELAITETLFRASGEPVFPTSHMVGVRIHPD